MSTQRPEREKQCNIETGDRSEEAEARAGPCSLPIHCVVQVGPLLRAGLGALGFPLVSTLIEFGGLLFSLTLVCT